MTTTQKIALCLAITWLGTGFAPAAEPQPAGAAPAAEKPKPEAEKPAAPATAPGPIRVQDAAAGEKTKAEAEAAGKATKPAPADGKRGERVVEFDRAPASAVISFVAEGAKVNIAIDPACTEKLKAPVSFKSRGMTYRQVLDWATRLSGTAWVLADGAVFVTIQENVPKVDVTEAVKKFLAEHPKFAEPPQDFPPPPEMEMGFPGIK